VILSLPITIVALTARRPDVYIYIFIMLSYSKYTQKEKSAKKTRKTQWDQYYTTGHSSRKRTKHGKKRKKSRLFGFWI